jgi:hypothetical protein
MELKTETQQESCRFQSSLETGSGGGHHSGALGESGCAESALGGSAHAGYREQVKDLVEGVSLKVLRKV